MGLYLHIPQQVIAHEKQVKKKGIQSLEWCFSKGLLKTLAHTEWCGKLQWLWLSASLTFAFPLPAEGNISGTFEQHISLLPDRFLSHHSNRGHPSYGHASFLRHIFCCFFIVCLIFDSLSWADHKEAMVTSPVEGQQQCVFICLYRSLSVSHHRSRTETTCLE